MPKTAKSSKMSIKKVTSKSRYST